MIRISKAFMDVHNKNTFQQRVNFIIFLYRSSRVIFPLNINKKIDKVRRNIWSHCVHHNSFRDNNVSLTIFHQNRKYRVSYLYYKINAISGELRFEIRLHTIVCNYLEKAWNVTLGGSYVPDHFCITFFFFLLLFFHYFYIFSLYLL